MKSSKLKRLLTVKELAELLNVAQSTIYAWVSAGEINYYQLGKAIRFDEDEIMEWLKAHKVENRKRKHLSRLLKTGV